MRDTFIEWGLVLLTVAFILGVGLGFQLGTDFGTSRPHCPQEDSCYVDYRDGQWYVIEGERSGQD